MTRFIILFFMLKVFAIAGIGEITAISGKAFVVRGSSQILLQQHSKVEIKDIIKTMKNSKLQIIFNDKTVISLGQKAIFKIDEYLFSRTQVKAKFNISQGLFKSITGKIGKIAPQNFKLQTQNATIGVRGTTIIGETTRDRDHIICSAGKIIVSNHLGQVAVNMGEKTVVRRGYQPTNVTQVSVGQISKIDRVLNSTNTVDTQTSNSNQANSEPQETTWGEWDEKDLIKQEQESIKEIKDDKEEKKEEEDQTLQSNLAELQILRDKAGHNPTYNGKVSGFINQNILENKILDNANNHINLNFDLGQGTMNGDIAFEAKTKTWNADIKNGKIDPRGQFDFSLQNTNLTGSGDGMLSGNKLQNADGSFKIQNATNNEQAYGTFNATKN